VDQVVAGDAIQAVVPLLTFYADVDGEGPTYQCARALAGGIHARGRSCLGSHSDVCCLLLLLQSHRSASSARWICCRTQGRLCGRRISAGALTRSARRQWRGD